MKRRRKKDDEKKKKAKRYYLKDEDRIHLKSVYKQDFFKLTEYSFLQEEFNKRR